MVKPHSRTSIGLLVAMAATIVLASCDLGLWGPSGPGEIQVALFSPHGPEGAAVLELTGGVGLGEVTTALGEAFYEHDDGTTRVVIILDEPGPIEFTVRSDDVGARPSVTLVQVADAANYLRTDLSGYWVELERNEGVTASGQRRSP
jgi:hypothetical protein